MNKYVESINKAAKNFKTNIELFSPAQGVNGFNEANILNYVVSSILSDCNGLLPYYEVPIQNENYEWKNRIDSFLFSKDISIAIEAKQLYKESKWKEICKDIDRLNEANIKRLINQFRKIEISEIKVIKIIIAECWGDSKAQWWKNGTNLTWDRSPLLAFDHVDTIFLKKYRKNSDNLYWALAIKESKINLTI